MLHRRTHLYPYTLLHLLFVFLATTWAQPSSQVTGLSALHRSGQTFLTWNEISGADVVYKVYRHSSSITNIASATYLGQVDQNSSLNQRAQDAGLSSYYRINDLGTPLSASTGLFVNTSTSSGNFYYAVVAANGGGTNANVTLGSNSLNSAVSETVGLPEPVLQSTSDGSHYVHWTNFQNTPLLPAMANRPGVTYNFICNNIETGSTQHLNVGLYGGSNDFTTEVDKIDGNGFELQLDDPRPDLFAPANSGQDDAVNPINICWYGYGENFSAGQVLTSGNVPNYLQRHAVYIINWVLRKWSHVDEQRVYLTGSSFGGIGAIALGMAYPQLFAAIWANVPRMDMGEPEWDLEYESPITSRYQTIWGTPAQNLPTPNIKASYPDYAAIGEGYNVYDRLDQVYVAQQNPQTDFPVIITGVGKQDSHVGWHEKPRYIDAMNASKHQLYLYWENTGHKFETTTFDSVYKRTQLLQYRRDLSYPAISNLSINNNPGAGNDLIPGGSVTGQSQGTINGYVGWQGSSVIDTPSQYRIKVFLRAGLLDAFSATSGLQTATATITPRRLQNFPRTPNATYSFENRRASDNVLLASGSVTADANGLVHVSNFQVSRTGNYFILNNSTPVNQAPNAIASATPTSGTAPLNVQFTGSTSNDPDGSIASYAWSFGDGGTATTANPARTYSTAGNYSARLIVTDDDGAKDTAFVAIQVSAPNQAPNAIASATPTSGIAPLNVQFTGSTSNDPDGSIASYAWSFGDGGTATTVNPARTYSTAGNYAARLIVTDNLGAKDTAFVAIQVTAPGANQPPNAIASATPTSGTAPLNVQFTGSASNDPDGSIASYAWSFGDGGTATTANPAYAYNTAGNYAARLIVTDNLGAKDTAFVAIQATSSSPGNLPTLRVNVGGPQYVTGSGKTFLADQVYSAGSFGYLAFTDLRTTVNPIANTEEDALYQDARGNDPFNYRFDVPNGTYDVLLHFAEIQDDGATKRVMDVNVEGVLKLDELDVWVAAGGRDIAYTSLLSNIAVTDGQLNIDFFRTPASTKRKPVVSAIEIGAVGALTGVANQAPNAIASATPTSGTAPLNVQFTGSTSNDPDGSIASYAWSFGDGGTATTANPARTYSTAGNYSARLIVTDNLGAKDTAFVAIQVNAPNQAPNAIASATPTSGIAPLNVQFTGSTSNDPDGSIASYAWNFGDGGTATSANPARTYSTAGNYSSRLIVTDNLGAKDTAFVAIQVSAPNQAPNAIASATPTSGTTPLNVQFTGSSSNDADGSIASYAWSFGDGGTATTANPARTYSTAGNYSARLIVTDNLGAKDTAFVAIQVSAPNQAPNAIASATPTSGTAPLNVQFTGSSSTDVDGSIASYAWSFGDGGSATTANPSRTYSTAGNYSARLIVTDNLGAKDTAFVAIQVSAPNQAPNAIVSATPTSGIAPLNVQFTGSSSNDADGSIASYAWSFGDGGTATTANPARTYSTAGNYSARLIVTDNLGAKDTAFVAIQASAANCASLPDTAAYGKITGGDQAHVDKMTYCFNGMTGNVQLKYQAYDIDTAVEGEIQLNGKKILGLPTTGDGLWSGDLFATLPDSLVNNTGTNTLVFENLKNPPSSQLWGVRRVSVSATTNQIPEAVASANITSGPAPLTVQFTGSNSTDSDGTITSYRWAFRDGNLSQVMNPLKTFNAAGSFNVRLIVIDNQGGRDTTYVMITVTNNIPPNAVASATPTSGIAPLNVQFTGSTSNDPDGTVASYAWSFGEGGSASTPNPQYVYHTPGNYNARLIVTDNAGAKDTAFVAVQANANQPPNAVASATPTSGNKPLLVQFTGASSSDSDGSIASFKWSFGDGDSAALANPSHTYNNAGNYLARLIVTDNLGAKDTAEVAITVTTPAASTIIRVNAGGAQHTATNGNVFGADKLYAPGSWGYVELGYIKTTTTGISNTTESPMYQDLHEKAELSYRFDVPNGTYDLILHFVEIADNEANRRLIDASAEGSVVVDNLDVWVAAGGKYVAHRRLITGVVVSDGQLNLDFVRAVSTVKRPPAVAAIEVGTAGSLSLPKESASAIAEAFVPEAYALEQNYPNPFNPSTVVSFSLPQAGQVRLAFYNALGQPARKPIVRYFTAGRYKITIDASDWPAGMYFYELKVNDYRALKKMILAK